MATLGSNRSKCIAAAEEQKKIVIGKNFTVFIIITMINFTALEIDL